MLRSERRLFKTLPPAPRRKILEYIQNPSYVGWLDIRKIVVTSFGDPLAIFLLDSKWGASYPHALLIARASRHVEARNQALAQMEI